MNLVYFDTALGFASVMLMLSLLVTIIVQAVGTLINLRGNNLRWGVERLIGKLDPDNKAAKVLSDTILTNDALSHSMGRYAVAIRPEELKLVLEDVKRINGDNAIGKAAGSLLGKISAGKERFETWFNTVMDRTTERFVARTSVITVLVSFLLAIALHIDTPHIVRNLSSKPEVRTALVAAALNEAVPLYQQLEKGRPLPVETLGELAKSNKEVATALAGGVPDLKTRAEGRTWIVEKIADPARRDAIAAEYEKAIDKLGRERLDSLGSSYRKIGGLLDASQLELGPPDASYCSWGPFKCEFHQITVVHIAGIIITGAFLGLGAPFWFNLLRNLSNMRPILAGKVEKGEEKAS